ncbi:MAG: hypothetical protein IKO47_03690 [Ruminococcus sp.]|nr:hypothetical protein [Ruminococcus sp.]
MGNYINVNLDDIKSAETAISTYLLNRAAKLAVMQSEVEQSRSAWRAEDNDAFMLKWNAMTAPDGIITVTGENLGKYRELLKAAHDLYKKAQSESVEQASKVSGWT